MKITDWLYILDEHHNPVPVTDMLDWAMKFENDQTRIVAQTDVNDEIRVSTVFLGIDSSFGMAPRMFETMIFGGEHNLSQWRYATWDEAVAGHQAAIEKIFEVSQ